MDATMCFSTLEVRASRASNSDPILSLTTSKFQYPRSSGQSCKAEYLPGLLAIIASFSTLEVRASRARILPSPCRHKTYSFSTLEVRANRASPLAVFSAYQRSSFSTLEVRANRASYNFAKSPKNVNLVSVPSKFGPIVQAFVL